VCWNSKSLLVELHACHNVSPCLNGGCGILRHMASHELCLHHIPLTDEILQVLLCDL
jgi:hypothetical protein